MSLIAKQNTLSLSHHYMARMLASVSIAPLMMSGMMMSHGLAQNLPQNGTVAAGQASIATNTPTQMTITQSSASAIINWSNFSIGQNYSVNFNQPNTSSVILNRVTSDAPSTIAGQLTGNGQVYLVNPNGIAITKTGVVAIGGGFIASTLGINDADFLAGNRSFAGTGASKAVSNDGVITLGKNGYVALLGGAISNNGIVRVPLGKVGFGAGEQATLDLTGDGFMQVAIPSQTTATGKALIDVAGSVSAVGGSIDLKAATVKQAIRDAVNVSGNVTATSVTSRNGVITLDGGDGGNVTLASSAQLSTSHGKKSAGNGGAITVKGHDINVQKGAQISANAHQSGNGGTLSLKASGAGTYAGTFQAQAGTDAGNGGFIETSGAQVNFAGATISTSSPHGRAGTWLIDPTNITINDAAASSIVSALQGGNNVTLTTSGASNYGVTSSGQGDITINSPITTTSDGGYNTLTISADHALIFNASITLNPQYNLSLNTGTTSHQGYYTNFNVNNIKFNNGASIKMDTNSSLNINGTPYALTNSASDLAGKIRDNTSNIALAGDIDMSTLDSNLASDLHSSTFANYLEGLGHNISHANVNLTGANYGVISNLNYKNADVNNISFYDGIGAFADQNYGVIANVTLADSTIEGSAHVGGISGLNYGAITNAKVTNSTIQGLTGFSSISNGGQNYGGIAGDNIGLIDQSTIDANSTVYGNQSVGGIAGWNGTDWNGVYGTITNSSSYATVKAADYSSDQSDGANGNINGIGGLVGANWGTIDKSQSYGMVDATGGLNSDGNPIINSHYVGGLAGTNYNGAITNSKVGTSSTQVNVLGTDNVGGFVGDNQGTISTSQSNANVTGFGYFIGGFAGSNGGTISSSLANGTVDGSLAVANVGGFAGDNLGTISTSISNTKIIGTNIDVFIGNNDSGSVSDSYYIGPNTVDGTNITNNSDSSILTTSDSKLASSYSGLDFTNTWKIYDGVSTPSLQAFMQTINISLTATATGKVYDGTALVGSLSNWSNTAAQADLSALAVGFYQNNALVSNAKNVGTYNVGLDTSHLSSDLLQTYNISLNPNSTSSVSITPDIVTISGISANNKAYDGTNSATLSFLNVNFGSAALNTLAATDGLSLSATGTFNDANAATGKNINLSGLTLTNNALGNYQLASTGNQTTATADITKAIVTVSNITVANKVYDGTTSATLNTGTASFAGLISGDVLTASATGIFSDANAGSGKTVTLSGLSLGGTSLGNYQLAASGNQTTATADITPKTVTVSGIIANNKPYDGNTDASLFYYGVTYAGKLQNDSLKVTATGAFTDTNVGTNKTINISGLTLSGDSVNNYALATTGNQTTTNADITKAIITVLGITAANKTYDGGLNASLSYSNVTFTGLVNGESLNISANGTFADKNVGTGKTVTLSNLSLGGTSASNYKLATTGNQTTTTADIIAKSVTVSGVSAYNKSYDGNTSAILNTASASFAGLISGDSLTLTGTGTFANVNADNHISVALSDLTLGGTSKNNYVLASSGNQSSTSANITPAIVTITGIGAYNKAYDRTKTASLDYGYVSFGGSQTLNDLAQKDALGVTATGTFSDANADTGKTVTLASLSLTNNALGNYQLASTGNQTTTTADITKAIVTVTGITASNKIYDGTTSATLNTATASFAGLISGDVLTASATGAFADKNAGTGKTVNLSNLALGGTSANNYLIDLPKSQSTTTANITPASVTVTGITANNKTYDGTTSATLNTATASFAGLISGDVLTASATGAFADKNAGTGKTVNLSNLALGGTSANNYTLAASGNQSSTTANITQGYVYVTPTEGQYKYAGAADPVLTYTLYSNANLVNASAYGITGALSRVAGNEMGSYDYTLGTLSSNNFSVAFGEVVSKFTIKAAPTTNIISRLLPPILNTNSNPSFILQKPQTTTCSPQAIHSQLLSTGSIVFSGGMGCS